MKSSTQLLERPFTQLLLRLMVLYWVIIYWTTHSANDANDWYRECTCNNRYYCFCNCSCHCLYNSSCDCLCNCSCNRLCYYSCDLWHNCSHTG